MRKSTLFPLFVVVGGVAFLAGLPANCAAETAVEQEVSATSRPNILFILTDDHRWDALSCMGHPFIETPNLDRIAREGVRFQNAFVTTSLCSPSRASFLTGMYAHSHGVLINDMRDPDPAYPIFPVLLQEHGYETAFIGKWHMAVSGEPRPGFDYWLSFRSQGVYTDPIFNENGSELQASGYVTDLLSDYAIRWLDQPRQRPFCLILSQKGSHHPFTPAPRHRQKFQNVDIPEPPSHRDTLVGKPPWLRIGGGFFGMSRRTWPARRKRVAPEELPPTSWNPRFTYLLDYYRTLLAIDEGVGRVLQALEEKGGLDSTIVAYAGDNGFMIGEHRYLDKRLIYEESLRIPLLVRYPPVAQAGMTPIEMVLNIDVAPTLLELVGIPIPSAMQGRSFRPLLAGDETPWRSSFLYEYFAERAWPGYPLTLAVRTERWKYAKYPDVRNVEELYDLEKDPYELRNLAEDALSAVDLARMRKELEALVVETDYRPDPKLFARPEVFGLRSNRPDLRVLEFLWKQDTEQVARDTSPFNHEGEIQGTVLEQAPCGPARRFSGGDSIHVPPSKPLDPSLGAWTVEVWAQPEAPDGVILQHGGRKSGYGLVLEDGIPRFYFCEDGITNKVTGKESLVGEWTHLAGQISETGKLNLFINGSLADSIQLRNFIGENPARGLRIGSDAAEPIGGCDPLGGFRGSIGPVRVYAGGRTAEKIAADAAEGGS